MPHKSSILSAKVEKGEKKRRRWYRTYKLYYCPPSLTTSVSQAVSQCAVYATRAEDKLLPVKVIEATTRRPRSTIEASEWNPFYTYLPLNSRVWSNGQRTPNRTRITSSVNLIFHKLSALQKRWHRRSRRSTERWWCKGFVNSNDNKSESIKEYIYSVYRRLLLHTLQSSLFLNHTPSSPLICFTNHHAAYTFPVCVSCFRCRAAELYPVSYCLFSIQILLDSRQ